jgi:secondary thiamine-phosphate synthase enzyme
MHLTASVIIQDEESESGPHRDIVEWVEQLAPEDPHYRHHQTGEDNGDAHLKNLLLHHQVVLPITNGRIDFGRGPRLFYCEFDGQRTKRVIVKIIGE